VDLRQLRHLVAIIDAGSLSRAAALVHVAQPALSLQVAALEAELGTRLLDRSSAGVGPTPAGRRLYRHAQTILRQVDAARADVACAEAISGRVSVGLPTSLYFVSQYNGLREPTLAMEDVQHRALALPSTKHSLRALIEQAFARLGVELNVVADLDSLPTLRGAVERGIADTILPLAGLGYWSPGCDTVSVQRLVSPGITRPIALCRPAGAPASAAAVATADILAGEISRMVADGIWGGATAHAAMP
jgi:DNA-binding transcriptional LysR family regulator